MLTELDILDHVLLNNNCMLMLVVDTEDVWKIESTGGFFNFKQKKLQQERNLEHLICLKKKIENYIGYIYNNGIKISFPDYDTSKQYKSSTFMKYILLLISSQHLIILN